MIRKFELLLLIVFAVTVAGCGDKKEEPTPTVEHNSQHNHDKSLLKGWLTVNMDENYLWNEEFKAKNVNYGDINNNEDYETFFMSLLSMEDGKTISGGSHYYYSYVERRSMPRGEVSGRAVVSGDLTYGFDLTVLQIDGIVDPPIVLCLKYVSPGSPADLQGLKRGDIITKVDGQSITWSNVESLYYKLYSGNTTPSTTTLTVSTLKIVNDLYVLEAKGTYTVTPAAVSDSPLQFAKVQTINGQKVGYVLYNSFERGPSNSLSDFGYDKQMKEIFRTQFADCNALVLDFRYNGGGYVSSAQLMTSMIMPVSREGQVIAEYQYNADVMAKQTSPDYLRCLTLSQMNSLYGGGAGVHLNVNKIYILVSDASASASELVIHMLRGHDIKVYLVGEQTEGKNGGMFIYGSDDKDNRFGDYYYEAAIMAFFMKNKKGEISSKNGFTPDFNVSEYWAPLGELGTENDLLFWCVKRHLETGSFPVSNRSRATMVESVNNLKSFADKPQGLLRHAGE